MDRAGRHPARGLLLLAAVVLGAAVQGKAAASPPATSADLAAIRPIVDDALDASQLTGASRDVVRDRFDALAAEVTRRFGRYRSEARRGRRLHDYLHAHVFRLYRQEADGLDAVLERGEFNCVSAAVLEGLLDRALGLAPKIVPGDHHVFLRLELPGRSIDVEPTAPEGFDVHGDEVRVRAFLLAYKLATADEIAARGARALLDAHEGYSAPVDLHAAPAFVWYNEAERALERGEGLRAARTLFQGCLRHPGVAARPAAVEAIFSRAFRQDYDGHRFEDAYETAVLGVTLEPENASAVNRLVAAGAELVEAAAERGDTERGGSLVQDVIRRIGGEGRRFERSVLPTLIAAAVRTGAWDRADCLADAYAEVEPDPVEAERVAAWVGARRALAFRSGPPELPGP